jgi:hypothetical protein
MTEITKTRFADVPIDGTFYNIDSIPFLTLIKTGPTTARMVEGADELTFNLNERVGVDADEDEEDDDEDEDED